MADPRVPRRLQWALELLDVSPDDEILEIGPGPGVSLSLVAGRLAGGRITAIERSATAIQRATRRNAAAVAAGKAVVEHLDLADVEPVRRALSGRRFDKAFAVNLNLFWVRPAPAELRLIKDLLRPGGVLRLLYETPGPEQASRVADAVAAALRGQGFAAVATTADSATLICITGRRPRDAAPAGGAP